MENLLKTNKILELNIRKSLRICKHAVLGSLFEDCFAKLQSLLRKVAVGTIADGSQAIR
jgi:hypothetical protein